MNELRLIPRPKRDEYPPYSEKYMELVPDGDQVLRHLKENFEKIKAFVFDLPEERLCFRYADGKWSIKEILVHLIDDERIYAYRALCFARADKTELPEFDQDPYVYYSKADDRTLQSIFEEYEAVRSSTIALFNGFPEEALIRSGANTGNVNNRTVRALAWHIAGHELWHIRIIKEQYLGEDFVNW